MLSRCMTDDRRAPADVKVLGFYDISGAHFHSPARRTIVINVPRDDDECKSGCAVLDSHVWNEGRSTVLRCCNPITVTECDTGTLSTCLYHSSAVDMSVFRRGVDFVVSGTRTQQKEVVRHESAATLVWRTISQACQASCHIGTMHSSWGTSQKSGQ